MYIHLVIANIAVFVPTVIGIGWAVGFLSGLFGVGGGFLVTPLLMFIGIPTDVSVATGACQAVATSASAALAQWRQNNVDLKVAGFLIAGGIVGAVLGVFLVAALRSLGQIDATVAVCYALLLGSLGLMMSVEGATAIIRASSSAQHPVRRSKSHFAWIHGLPLKTRFHRSKLYMSAIPPVTLGCFVGILSAVMGVGGGFVLVPAMVYLLKMPTRVVVGTSLVQVVAVSSATTFAHASENKTVDVELAILLIIGGVIGAHLGARIGQRLPSEKLRLLLGLLVLAVGARFALGLIIEPSELYTFASR